MYATSPFKCDVENVWSCVSSDTLTITHIYQDVSERIYLHNTSVDMRNTQWTNKQTSKQLIYCASDLRCRYFCCCFSLSFHWIDICGRRQTYHIGSIRITWSIIYGSFESATVDSTIIYAKSRTNRFDRKTYDILSGIEWEQISGM